MLPLFALLVHFGEGNDVGPDAADARGPALPAPTPGDMLAAIRPAAAALSICAQLENYAKHYPEHVSSLRQTWETTPGAASVTIMPASGVSTANGPKSNESYLPHREKRIGYVRPIVRVELNDDDLKMIPLWREAPSCPRSSMVT